MISRKVWLFECLLIVCCLTTHYLFADSRSCYNDLQENFFEKSLVNQALSLGRVPQAVWFLINNDLAREARKVPRRVADRAKKLPRNPFRTPFQFDVALQLLIQEEYAVFSFVMFKHNITNPDRIQNTFNYIKDNRMQRLSTCLE